MAAWKDNQLRKGKIFILLETDIFDRNRQFNKNMKLLQVLITTKRDLSDDIIRYFGDM